MIAKLTWSIRFKWYFPKYPVNTMTDWLFDGVSCVLSMYDSLSFLNICQSIWRKTNKEWESNCDYSCLLHVWLSGKFSQFPLQTWTYPWDGVFPSRKYFSVLVIFLWISNHRLSFHPCPNILDMKEWVGWTSMVFINPLATR